MSLRAGTIAALALSLVVVAACGKSADGEPCQTKDDCESGVCSIGGKCGTGECACTGAECNTIRSSCADGQVCFRGTKPEERDYTTCRNTCSASKACPSDQHCEVGICQPGPEAFGLTWVSFPRTRPCAARVPCKYEVKPSAGVTVSEYAWSFGAKTTTPTTEFTWDKEGSYDVSVTATATTGATARVSATEILCIAQGNACDPTGAPCCSGLACSLQNMRCP